MLAPPNGFIVLDALVASDALKNHRFFIVPVGWNQKRNRLADGLVGRIAEEPLRALVPARDDAIEVLAYDGVVAGFDDGRELLQSLLAFAQGNQVRGLSGQHVQEPQSVLRGLMWLAPMG